MGEPKRVGSIYIAYKSLRLSRILRHLRILRALSIYGSILTLRIITL